MRITVAFYIRFKRNDVLFKVEVGLGLNRAKAPNCARATTRDAPHVHAQVQLLFLPGAGHGSRQPWAVYLVVARGGHRGALGAWLQPL